MTKAEQVERRAILVAVEFTRTGKTVRELAEEFGVTKSTIHIDLVQRLPKYEPYRALIVRAILDSHKRTRHIKGGEATRRHWLNKRYE